MIAAVRPWIRARMVTLGYSEHTDGFNFSNIPSTAMRRVYHIETGEVSSKDNTVDNLTCEVPFRLRLFFPGSVNVKAKIDLAEALADTVIREFLKPANRLGGVAALKDVRFSSARIEPVADSNDNSLIVNTAWTATVAMGTRGDE